MKKFNAEDITEDGKKKFSIKKADTKVKDFYDSEKEYLEMLAELQDQLDDLQTRLYANSKYGILVIFQAMDAAGKDGTMKAVFKNVNPLGLKFYSFKRPSTKELNHDYLWRCFKELPERGTVQVFNRSYYEEVLVVKVHPEILHTQQRIPDELIAEDVWADRYEDIKNFEKYLSRNGIKVIKFFLNVSREEQSDRLIERIEDASKNWKFEDGDIKERDFWDDYMAAYEDMINATATKRNPWYVIPADDKKNMRLMVARILVENLKGLNLEYPESSEERRAQLEGMIGTIREQNKK
ncbi:MAG: polyphosphate kinase 2 family protein [Leadbetterella sp.]|nr:polyphosphate kinase 2 family protein [Leadbetterella sp.]